MMTPTLTTLLVLCFLLSVAALGVLIWSIFRGQISAGQDAARSIFDSGEEGVTEEPAATRNDLEQLRARQDASALAASDLAARRVADTSSRRPVLWFLLSSLLWLLVGSVAGLIVSIKFHAPDWLSEQSWLTLGRLRPFHLNAMIYGWVSMAGMAIALWLMPRLVHHPLVGERMAVRGAVLWNIAMIGGLAALLAGWTDGLEWLEFPWQIDMAFVIAGGMAGVPLLLTVRRRKTRHLYVSAWYAIAAFIWFPLLFVIANLPSVHFGVEHAVVNWWFAHNVLGLWLTPLGLAAAYYLIPKVTGKPIHSYHLSLIGFWALALFYSQVGVHHLIGGPVPTWLVNVSIVSSVAMFAPVIAVGINHHMTMRGSFRMLRYSPTLRFVVLGAILYTVVSVQGSLTSLRTINTVTHFTQYTVAHAHLGVYGFVSLIFFGSIYFLLPRVTGREWPFPRLISMHFWLAAGGLAIYVVFLSIGGVLQGLAMLDEAQPFEASVRVTIPYLVARTIGGGAMTVSHFLFAAHVAAVVLKIGPARVDPAQFQSRVLVEGGEA